MESQLDAWMDTFHVLLAFKSEALAAADAAADAEREGALDAVKAAGRTGISLALPSRGTVSSAAYSTAHAQALNSSGKGAKSVGSAAQTTGVGPQVFSPAVMGVLSPADRSRCMASACLG